MEFIDPPKHRQPSQYWIDVAQTCRASGKWVLTGDYSVAVASHIRAGKYPAFVPRNIEDKRAYMHKHWQVQSEKLPHGRYNVYVKWVGDGDGENIEAR